MLRHIVLIAVVSSFLAVAAPARAQSDRFDRQSAEKALDRVESLLGQKEIRDKHKLTLALVEMARQRSELAPSDRKRAAAILARPTNGTGPGQWTAPPGDRRMSCTARVCVHWVVGSTVDAPPSEDIEGGGNGRPDFVDLVVNSFEQSLTREVDELGWLSPLSDSGRGGSNLLDVYLSNIGDDAYGYAVPEDNARSSSGYLVLDNDYSDAEFPGYDGIPTVPVHVTAAHELNHVLQYRYDSLQDLWMLESTATWAEEKVYDAANDYLAYLGSWASKPEVPVASTDSKMYGSAIWNHWLDARFGQDIIRQAWAASASITVDGGGFAPAAYDTVIRGAGGAGFGSELASFFAATAEWDAANSGIREGVTFPSEVRSGGPLPVGGAPASGTLDHTAFALYDIAPPDADNLYLTGGLPAGITGSIALVGFENGSQTRVVGTLDGDGKITVTLPDPGRFSRITAVVANTDVSHTGLWNGVTKDWNWTRNAQSFLLSATTSAPPEPTVTSPTPDETGTPSPTVSPTVTPAPTVPPPAPASLRLTRNSSRIGSVLRKGMLSLFGQANKAGSHSARATVDATTAKRLKVGRRTTTAGTGRRTASAPAKLKINVKLTRKLRAALKRNRKRSVKVKVAVTFRPADGTAAVLETLTVKLKP